MSPSSVEPRLLYPLPLGPVPILVIDARHGSVHPAPAQRYAQRRWPDMKYRDPLEKILSQARPCWDRDEMRPAVRTVAVRRKRTSCFRTGVATCWSAMREIGFRLPTV